MKQNKWQISHRNVRCSSMVSNYTDIYNSDLNYTDKEQIELDLELLSWKRDKDMQHAHCPRPLKILLRHDLHKISATYPGCWQTHLLEPG